MTLKKKNFENIVGKKRENACFNMFLAPLAIGQRAYVMARCVFVCPCVNFFF